MMSQKLEAIEFVVSQGADVIIDGSIFDNLTLEVLARLAKTAKAKITIKNTPNQRFEVLMDLSKKYPQNLIIDFT